MTDQVIIEDTAQTLVRTRRSKKEYWEDAINNPVGTIRECGGLSLFEFVVYFWSEVSTDKFKSNWHIEKVLCPELEKIAKRVVDKLPKLYDLIINVPPGTTKTIICSIMFPAWCWTEWYWMRFITGSYSASLSLESAEYSRDLIRSNRFRMLYPELGLKEDKDTKSNFKVIKKIFTKVNKVPRIFHGGNRYSTSVGGSVTGFHGHIIIIDDPLNPEQAVSEVELKTANRWIEQTLSTRKVDKAITPIILIMQRLHQDDPTGHTLAKKKKNIKHISLPGEIRNYREQVQPQELIKYYKNDLLDPVRMDWDVLEDMKADLGQYGYAGQIGQKPTPPGGGMFKVDHFNIITVMLAEVNLEDCVRYWDKAGTEGGGAYTAGVKMHKLKSGRFIIENVKRGQWSTEERERIIKETAIADGYHVQIGVEQEPGSGGKESAEATVRNLAGFSCFTEKPIGDKPYRADPFSVQVNNGNVMLLQGDWNHDFIEEYRFFPFSTYKDQVDAGSGGFKRLTEKRMARMIM